MSVSLWLRGTQMFRLILAQDRISISEKDLRGLTVTPIPIVAIWSNCPLIRMIERVWQFERIQFVAQWFFVVVDYYDWLWGLFLAIAHIAVYCTVLQIVFGLVQSRENSLNKHQLSINASWSIFCTSEKFNVFSLRILFNFELWNSCHLCRSLSKNKILLIINKILFII